MASDKAFPWVLIKETVFGFLDLNREPTGGSCWWSSDPTNTLLACGFTVVNTWVGVNG